MITGVIVPHKLRTDFYQLALSDLTPPRSPTHNNKKPLEEQTTEMHYEFLHTEVQHIHKYVQR